MIHLVLALALAAQCPPGSTSCPTSPRYVFDATKGQAAPWSTAVRITARLEGSREANIGSGTVIESWPGHALVMTCAHVLRFTSTPVVVVEVFGGKLRADGSVGGPLASYRAVAIDRDDATDVGLVRFSPREALSCSLLVAPHWTVTTATPLCSVGCSRGADPTAVPEAFARLTSLYGGRYRGIECVRRPVSGRSGGGLFDDAGRLVGVCDLAVEDGGGMYATTESLRAILRKNGLVELAEGRARSRPSGSNREETPITRPPPDVAIDLVRDSLDLPSTLASIAVPALAGSGGTAVVGLIAWVSSRLRKKPPSPTGIPPPEQLVPLLIASLKAQGDAEKSALEREAKAKADAELLERIKALVEGANRPNP